METLERCGRNLALSGEALRATRDRQMRHGAYVSCGSFASNGRTARLRGMSAVPPIATELMRLCELTRCANRRRSTACRGRRNTFLTVACSVEGTHWWRRHFSGHPTIPREQDGLLSLEGH